MPLVVPNAGEVSLLTAWLSTGKTLRLFSNNVTPGETDTAATYTEVTGNGYAAIALAGGAASIVGGAPTTATYAQQTFTFSGAAGNVYGYYVTETTGGGICWAERFSDGPYAIANSGDQIKVTPTITAD